MTAPKIQPHAAMTCKELEEFMRGLAVAAEEQIALAGEHKPIVTIVRPDGADFCLIGPMPDDRTFRAALRSVIDKGVRDPRTVAIVFADEAWMKHVPPNDVPAVRWALDQGFGLRDMPGREECLVFWGVCRAGEVSMSALILREGNRVRLGAWQVSMPGSTSSRWFTGLHWPEPAA